MERLFTDNHEWVSIEGDLARVGITRYFANSIGDILHVELPATGRRVEQFDMVCLIRSTAGFFEVLAPFSGEIIESNVELSTFMEILSVGAEQDAWVFKIRLAGLMGALDAEMEKLYDDYQYHDLLCREAKERR